MPFWLLFCICLVITIVLHEIAHMIAASLVGCGVEIVSLGFGKPVLWSKEIKGIKFQITPWILGGYCKLKGEDKAYNGVDGLFNLTYSRKVFVVIAGCWINIFLGAIVGYINFLYFNNLALFFFAQLSILLGITNLLPIPALDGCYPVLFTLEKFFSREKAFKIINKIVGVCFILIIILNVVCIPYMINQLKSMPPIHFSDKIFYEYQK